MVSGTQGRLQFNHGFIFSAGHWHFLEWKALACKIQNIFLNLQYVKLTFSCVSEILLILIFTFCQSYFHLSY